MGHQVALVENGKDALAALAGENFDIVLMDLRMPVMNGDAADSTYYRHPACPGVPAVYGRGFQAIAFPEIPPCKALTTARFVLTGRQETPKVGRNPVAGRQVSDQMQPMGLLRLHG